MCDSIKNDPVVLITSTVLLNVMSEFEEHLASCEGCADYETLTSKIEEGVSLTFRLFQAAGCTCDLRASLVGFNPDFGTIFDQMDKRVVAAAESLLGSK